VCVMFVFEGCEGVCIKETEEMCYVCAFRVFVCLGGLWVCVICLFKGVCVYRRAEGVCYVFV